jgi:hypothetical protein
VAAGNGSKMGTERTCKRKEIMPVPLAQLQLTSVLAGDWYHNSIFAPELHLRAGCTSKSHNHLIVRVTRAGLPPRMERPWADIS